MNTDTRYARATGTGTSYLGMIEASAENALEMLNGDYPDSVMSQAYVKSALEGILEYSKTGKNMIAEIIEGRR